MSFEDELLTKTNMVISVVILFFTDVNFTFFKREMCYSS